MIKYYLLKIIPFTVLLISIYSVQRYSSYPVGSTAIWWMVQAVTLVIFWIASYVLFERENKKVIRIFQLYLLWNVFSIIRGYFVAENYWDIKGLITNSFALLLPIIVYTASNKESLQTILAFYVRYILPVSILLLPFITLSNLGWYLFPISFLMFFFPVLNMRWKMLLLVITLVSVVGGISTRSFIFKYGIPLLLVLFYYLRFFILSTKILAVTRHILLIAPWVLFFLAVTGVFNVFRINEYFKSDYVARSVNTDGQVEDQALTTDSRSALYEEVLKSAQKYNYWIIGRSPARGNYTEIFINRELGFTGRRDERLTNESHILNVFNWTGIVGVVFFFTIFYIASGLAINKSNNIYIKLIGLFVSFRWLYAWVEDETYFNINCFVIWMMVGICFSESFRKMNNTEVKLWARGIFERKYILGLKLLQGNVNTQKLKSKLINE